MEKYKLNEDEVVLYKGNISYIGSDEKVQLLLTNQHIVFTAIHKDFFEKEFSYVDVFAVESVKMYEGVPQIKSKGKNIEIYFKETEKEFVFESKSEMGKFIAEATKLLTGKSGLERKAEKVKEAIALTNDTFGVDVVHDVGEFIKDGGIGKIGKGIKVAGKGITKGIGALADKLSKK